MSEAVAAAVVAAPAPGVDKRALAESVLGEIFRLAEWPVKLEFKDVADGGIAVAVHFEAEVPGVQAGKKSYLVDSLQFLVNKVVNRPNTEKRWVTLGVGGFPEPRGPGAGEPRPPSAPPAGAAGAVPVPVAATRGASAPAAGRAPQAPQGKNGPAVAAPKQQPPQRPAPQQQRAAEVEEAVEVSPEWKALGASLSGKAVKHGRSYAVMLLSNAERAQLVKAASAAGVKVKVEGDGHFKRVAVVPDKATPMPRKMQFPDYDDEDEDAEG